VRESQTLLMCLRASMRDWSDAHSLKQQSSTSSSVWKKRLCSKEMWGKGVKGLKSNTVMFSWVTLICAQLKVITVTKLECKSVHKWIKWPVTCTGCYSVRSEEVRGQQSLEQKVNQRKKRKDWQTISDTMKDNLSWWVWHSCVWFSRAI
jgi:hypothetical protein